MKNRVFEKQGQSQLSRQVVGVAMRVHRILGAGFSESIYRNALAIELRKAGLAFVLHPTLSVAYEGLEIGVFQADIIVEQALIVELKAVDALNAAHAAQLVNYLTASKINDGLLINFGAPSLEFRTKTRLYRKEEPPPDLTL